MKNIIFWFDKPVFAVAGMIKELVDTYDNVFIFYKSNKDTDRGGINKSSLIKAFYFDSNSVETTLKNNKIDLNNSVHIINGFYSYALDSLCKIKKKYNLKIVSLMEPVVASSKLPHIEMLLKKIKYKLYKKNLKEYIDGAIFLGETGMEFYKKIGWNFKSIDSMYYPYYKSIELNDFLPKNDFYLYIGRNNLRNKGLGLIIKYFKKYRNKNLLIIGNYGKDSLKVKKICLSHENINIKESMGFQELYNFIIQNRPKCILTPSLIDGCNVNNYVSLITGTPCITTYESKNFTIIKNSDSGYVINHSYKEFENAMNKLGKLSDKQIKEMSKNAYSYSKIISPKIKIKDIINFINTL